MMRKWALLLALACSPAAAFGLFGPNVDAVKDRLDDPYSAKFEDVRKVPNGAVCGRFNAKNQYGAYAGRKEFAIVNGAAYLEGNANEENTIIAYCINGEDCKDSECAENILKDIQHEQDTQKYKPIIEELRLSVAQICANHVHGDAHKASACGLEFHQCRKNNDLVVEAKCYQGVVSKYR